MSDLIWKNILMYWKEGLEVFLLWLIIYGLLSLFRGTRGVQLFKGLLILAILLVLIQQLQLRTINWILTKLLAISVVALLVIFQPELRRALAQLGEQHFSKSPLLEESMIQEIIQSCTTLSQKKIGALIAIEKEVGLKPYTESGVILDSRLSSEILNTLFMPNTPLHDGAVIIENNRIAAAGCLLPLTQNPNLSRTFGTRHRAAIGLTEETDAMVIVVSEESGSISLAFRGQLSKDLDRTELINLLHGNLQKPHGINRWWGRQQT